MHERLKHLIISSEKFKEKKKAKYDAQARGKQIGRGKGVGTHSKGIRFIRISGKGKGLGRSGSKTEITPPHTSRSNQATGLTIGIQNELYCFVRFAFVDFCVPLLVLLWGSIGYQ